MKILTEIGWGHKPGGARRVAVQTLLEMIRIRPEHDYLICSNHAHEELLKTRAQLQILKPPRFIPQIVWDQFLFPHLAVPWNAKRSQPDVIHFTNNLVSYQTMIPAVVSIYDMLPFVMPESFRYVHGVYQRAYFRYAVKKARKIITISENSKNDICRILKVDENKVIVVPLAARLYTEAKQEKESIPGKGIKNDFSGPYILYAGAVHPRKNVARLIQAFVRLKKNQKIPHKLVIAGELRWKRKKSLPKHLVAEVNEDIILTGSIDDRRMAELYRNCSAFVYPSLYEGFGLPVLEAMLFGAPVVTSNISSLPEVAGDAALLVNPEVVEEIADAVWSIIDDPALADTLRSKGKSRAMMFSWEHTAEIVLDVLESVAGEEK